MKTTYTILMVEDSQFNRDLYRAAFTNAGFNVVLRENADGDFLDEVSTLKPDIISMDLMMGKDGLGAEHDGFEALTLLKGDLRTHDIPVIILTSFFEEGKVRKAKELGAVDFINTAGYKVQHLPEIYLQCVKQAGGYKAVHPIFRE